MDMKIKRGQILRQLRLARQLTQNEAAENFGISSQQTYQKYESGKTEPPYDLLCDFADFYGVSTDYLLGRTTVKRMATEETDPFADIDVAELEKRIIEKYTALNEEMRAFCIELFRQQTGVIITENGEVKYESSQKIQPKTYPIPTAARRGINGKYFSGNTEYMTEDEINAILNAEDGDEDL